MPPKIQSHFPLPSLTSPVHEPLFSEHTCSSTAQLTVWSAPQYTEWQRETGGRGRQYSSQGSCLLCFLGAPPSPTWSPSTSLFPVNTLKSSPSVFTLPEALRGEAARGTGTQSLRKPTQLLVRSSLHLHLLQGPSRKSERLTWILVELTGGWK